MTGRPGRVGMGPATGGAACWCGLTEDGRKLETVRNRELRPQALAGAACWARAGEENPRGVVVEADVTAGYWGRGRARGGRGGWCTWRHSAGGQGVHLTAGSRTMRRGRAADLAEPAADGAGLPVGRGFRLPPEIRELRELHEVPAQSWSGLRTSLPGPGARRAGQARASPVHLHRPSFGTWGNTPGLDGLDLPQPYGGQGRLAAGS